jgi:hypothetical protein
MGHMSASMSECDFSGILQASSLRTLSRPMRVPTILVLIIAGITPVKDKTICQF